MKVNCVYQADERVSKRRRRGEEEEHKKREREEKEAKVNMVF